MPRRPMNGARISSLMRTLSVGALLRVIPYGLIEEALDATDRQSQRRRLLPAPAVLLLVILLGLNAEVSVKENLRLLLCSVRVRFGLDRVNVAGGTAISFARRRLGVEPLRWLFDRVARPLGMPGQSGCFWHDLRPVAVDGTTVEVQCTEKNTARFGRGRNQHGRSGYPQMRVVALLECGTRAPLALACGAYSESEMVLAERLFGKLQSDMLLLADRLFFSFARWRDTAARCGALLWRVKVGVKPKVLKRLEDGSYLAQIKPSSTLIGKGLAARDERMTVRVVEYCPVMEDGSRGEPVKLFTTLLDPAEVTAEELAAAYPLRWAVETGYDELKTHLRGPARVLRSQLPELAEQELYGFFLAYYVTRAMMAEAARVDGCTPAELSFTHSVRVIRRHTALFPSTQ